MKPIEIFEYKQKWKAQAYTVTMYDWVRPHGFCKNSFDSHRWDAVKYAHPDDSHLFMFERTEDYNKFLAEFEL